MTRSFQRNYSFANFDVCRGSWVYDLDMNVIAAVEQWRFTVVCRGLNAFVESWLFCGGSGRRHGRG